MTLHLREEEPLVVLLSRVVLHKWCWRKSMAGRRLLGTRLQSRSILRLCLRPIHWRGTLSQAPSRIQKLRRRYRRSCSHLRSLSPLFLRLPHNQDAPRYTTMTKAPIFLCTWLRLPRLPNLPTLILQELLQHQTARQTTTFSWRNLRPMVLCSFHHHRPLRQRDHFIQLQRLLRTDWPHHWDSRGVLECLVVHSLLLAWL